jgi:hypothetical protein
MRLRLDLLVLLAATLGLATTSTVRSEPQNETVRVDQLFQQWDKHVSGALLSTGRIRNFRFERLAR